MSLGRDNVKVDVLEQFVRPESDCCLQVLSDLHIEIPLTLQNCEYLAEFRRSEGCEVLALLGDIGYPSKEKYTSFLYGVAAQHALVIVITGNHEYYRSRRERTHSRIQEICDQCPTGNIAFLQQGSIDFKGIRFLGTCLWSHVPPDAAQTVQGALTDYSSIKNEDGKPISVADTNAWHQEELAWLRSALSDATADVESNKINKVVVLTHHAPSMKNTSAPVHQGNLATHGFSTDLEELMSPPISLWAYGHTHYSNDQEINGVRVYSNQLGYFMKGERDSGFDPDALLLL